MVYLTAPSPLFLFGRAPLLSWKFCIVFTLFTLLCIGEGVTTGAALPCLSNQSVALLRFKESLSLRPQKFFSSWRNGSDCCTWKGVSCDGTGFVTSLDIYDLSAQASELHPSLFELGRLRHLELSFNLISGTIPSRLSELTDLTELSLSHCNFTGSIPESFRQLSNLTLLDLSNNNLSGEIPPGLLNLPTLQYLGLHANELSGPLPDFGNGFSILNSVYLSYNMLEGEIPSSISNLPHLEVLELEANRFSVLLLTIKGHFRVKKALPEFIELDEELPLTIKGQNHARRIIHMLAFIDLSNNLFIGRVPDEIGALDGLYSLNLSWNNLDGPIPRSLGHLQQMESLDLSHNQLSGSIPEELTRDTFLSVLDLSYNNLQGRIPQGNQFDTFNASSFDGNPRLCGSPLPISCPSTNLGFQDSNYHVREMARDLHWEYLAAGIGYSGLQSLPIAFSLPKNTHVQGNAFSAHHKNGSTPYIYNHPPLYCLSLHP
ncbi:DNA-damage-repair/toleration protein [Nymphaea thermarum]|nr:DNA-damage-repair/toleration protein [Nymphaea thermarum]